MLSEIEFLGLSLFDRRLGTGAQCPQEIGLRYAYNAEHNKPKERFFKATLAG